MLGRTYEDQQCSIARALEVVGERWTLLIVRDALLGNTRFEQFQASLGVARNVLASRLAALVDAGVLERAPYQTRPVRYEYRLTVAGRQLFTALLALMQWGDEHRPAPGGPPRTAHHATCGGDLHAAQICATCGTPVPVAEVTMISTVPVPA